MLKDTKTYRNKTGEAGLSTRLPDQVAMGQRERCLLDYKTGDKQEGNTTANIFCGVPRGSLLFHGFRSDGGDCKLSTMVKSKPDCKVSGGSRSTERPDDKMPDKN